MLHDNNSFHSTKLIHSWNQWKHDAHNNCGSSHQIGLFILHWMFCNAKTRIFCSTIEKKTIEKLFIGIKVNTWSIVILLFTYKRDGFIERIRCIDFCLCERDWSLFLLRFTACAFEMVNMHSNGENVLALTVVAIFFFCVSNGTIGECWNYVFSKALERETYSSFGISKQSFACKSCTRSFFFYQFLRICSASLASGISIISREHKPGKRWWSPIKSTATIQSKPQHSSQIWKYKFSM